MEGQWRALRWSESNVSVSDMDKVKRVFSGAPWESKVGYCRAIRVGQIIAVTGTAPLDERGEVFGAGNAYLQTKKCLETIEWALQELSAKRRNIIRTRIYVTDIKQWAEVGRAHAEFFADCPPATTMVEVQRLIDPKMIVEIEADAIVSP